MKKTKGSLLLFVALPVVIIALIVVLWIAKDHQKSLNQSATTKVTPEARARDVQRKSDVRSLAMASEIYKDAHNRKCPSSLSELANPDYIGRVPVDPKTGSSYEYKVIGTKCVISATLEDATDSNLKSDFDPANGAIFDKSTE